MDARVKNVEAPCLENEFLKQDWLIPESKLHMELILIDLDLYSSFSLLSIFLL